MQCKKLSRWTLQSAASWCAELCTATVHVEDHFTQLKSWIQQIGPSVPFEEVNDVVVCLEDTLTTLLCTFLVAPQLTSAVMRDPGHMFTSTIAHLHDVLLIDVIAKKIRTPVYGRQMQPRVDAVSSACATMSCHLLLEGLLRQEDEAGPSTSKAAVVYSKHQADALLSALGEMQAWS